MRTTSSEALGNPPAQQHASQLPPCHQPPQLIHPARRTSQKCPPHCSSKTQKHLSRPPPIVPSKPCTSTQHPPQNGHSTIGAPCRPQVGLTEKSSLRQHSTSLAMLQPALKFPRARYWQADSTASTFTSPTCCRPLSQHIPFSPLPANTALRWEGAAQHPPPQDCSSCAQQGTLESQPPSNPETCLLPCTSIAQG